MVDCTGNNNIAGNTVTLTSPAKPWKFCPECAQELEAEWKFCAGCGERLNALPYQWIIPQGPMPGYPLGTSITWTSPQTTMASCDVNGISFNQQNVD